MDLILLVAVGDKMLKDGEAQGGLVGGERVQQGDVRRESGGKVFELVWLGLGVLRVWEVVTGADSIMVIMKHLTVGIRGGQRLSPTWWEGVRIKSSWEKWKMIAEPAILCVLIISMRAAQFHRGW